MGENLKRIEITSRKGNQTLFYNRKCYQYWDKVDSWRKEVGKKTNLRTLILNNKEHKLSDITCIRFIDVNCVFMLCSVEICPLEVLPFRL
jgi:hypothetical protein